MRKKIYYFYILVLFNFIFISNLYSDQNYEKSQRDSDIEYIKKIAMEYNLEKKVSSDVEHLNKEKEELEKEVNVLIEKNKKLASETENVNNRKVIENNLRMKKDIEYLQSQVVIKTNSSENLSSRIKELEKDLDNERSEIDNPEYDSLTKEIEEEEKKIRETGEQIKKRREDSIKLKSNIILLDNKLQSYEIRDGLLNKVVDEYTTYHRVEINEKPDKSAKLVVLTQKLDAESIVENTNWINKKNTLSKVFKDCLVQYYIPLNNIRPENIKYDFRNNCLIIRSPNPILDEEMIYVQTDPEKVEKNLDRNIFSGYGTADLLDNKLMKEIKSVLIQAAYEKQLLFIEAKNSAEYHLKNFFRGFMKNIKGSSDVKIKIIFY